MFKQKKDIYAAAKLAAEIAIPRILANNPKIGAPIKLVCALVSNGEIDDLLDMVAKNNPKLFSKDPFLMSDIKAVLAYLGLMDVTIDRPKVEAVVGHVCKLI